MIFSVLSLLLLLCSLVASSAWAQASGGKVARVEIKHVGPQSVSDELIRSNIRVKPGDLSQRYAVDDDVRNLYATGLFYNIQVSEENTPQGVVLTYILQAKPRLRDIKFEGNKKFTDKKLRKKITSRIGEPADERKLFTDAQEIEKMYQKSGYPKTTVKYVLNIDEPAGRANAIFEVQESPKVKISAVEFIGATAFPQSKLRRVIKTRKHWMFSWITGSGHLKEEQFEDDKEKLADFYRNNGYIDFEIKDVQFVQESPRTMVIRFIVYEGAKYRVGSVVFSGNTIFSTAELTNGLSRVHLLKRGKTKHGPNGLPMDIADVFTPKGLTEDTEVIEDFYGSRGYIDVGSARNLRVVKVPNTETGTMDLEFKIEEGQKSYVDKIEIRGNSTTKDKVIRRELAISPGEVFDTVRMKISKQRLEGLQYFEKTDLRPDDTEIPYRKKLVVSVDEKRTGNFTVGAGFSSVDAIVGFAEMHQGNFDLFHPPTFSGGGQKFRLRVQLGTQRQDYIATFVEPWFLGRKLELGVDLYYRDLSYQSLENLYDETRVGSRVSLRRALGSDFLIGGVSYTIENVGIHFNEGPSVVRSSGGDGRDHPNYIDDPNGIPPTLRREDGSAWLSKFGASITYDTRNSVLLPNKGQRTELFGELVGGPMGGDKEFYKLDLKTSWYFPGLASGHVLEIVGRTGVAEAFGDTDEVPFYERYYLGGLYTLRGYRYRSVSPRDVGYKEPVGGNTYWFGSAEYSIPIIERLRFAMFYDVGSVSPDSYEFSSSYSDNWGIGIRLNLPIGPLRLDYGIPITHDEHNGSSGRFQFGVGYTRDF